MKHYCYTPLLIFILLYGTAQSSHTQMEGLSCVNDYLTNISCVWWNSDFTHQRCELEGDREFGRIPKCELVPLKSHSYLLRGCSVTFEEVNFFFADRICLRVFCNGSLITKMHYHPGRHIKTHPPDKPTVSGANITWSRGINFPNDIEHYEFELQFKQANTSWEMARTQFVSHGSSVVLNNNELTVGQEYQARVRVKPVEPIDAGYLKGEWSDWSPAVSWRSETGKTEPEENPPLVLIIGFHVLLVLAGISLIIYKVNKSSWLLKPKHQHVPDPSKYFQPLHTVHGGNFQKWLGCQNSVGPYLTPQSHDDISPIEVSDIWDVSLMDSNVRMSTATLLHSNQADSGLENSGTSHASSSGFSNIGYFYSKSRSGSLYLETCPVYFTYHPEEGPNPALSSSSSYERLQNPSYKVEVPLSPESGFDMEKHYEEDPDDEENNEEETSVTEGNNLVSYIISLSQGSLGSVRPIESFPPITVFTPCPEFVRAPSCSLTSEPADGAVVRPSSMIEHCGSGYLTLKEMQKFSNKSI
ncbi:interleukin-2 receptor subunit beta-like [Myxocyprinus asiaticus]|uniref:interleukin-2 receptor subunit beta-like n=1 Tax=Myxocyprinus asiaticus TaxID=70543 RepID=UPI00222368AF|nr:interleukin-2 receptor subunit beta-like [Myxocyprinus asiaticus]XP_051569692.1 interleukin-2 receptor subunit beta-like [Myxocyprinus asiaticus]